MTAAGHFDARHQIASAYGVRLLGKSERTQTKLIELSLFGLRSNRFNVQPLRMVPTNIYSNSNTIFKAQANFHMPLALAAGRQGGGPLVPHYSRTFQSEKPVEDARPAAPPEGPFTLYGSIWGPRCEWCDARDV